MSEIKQIAIAAIIGDNPSRLRKAAKSNMVGFRIYAASNRHTPPEFLSALMEDSEALVIHQLASNPSLGKKDAEQLVDALSDHGSRIYRLLKTAGLEKQTAYALSLFNQELTASYLWRLAMLPGSRVTFNKFNKKTDFELGIMASDVGIDYGGSVIDRKAILKEVSNHIGKSKEA